MVTLPGGPFVMGSAKFPDAPPHWVELSSYRLGVTAVPEADFRDVMDRAGHKKAPKNHPVVNARRSDAIAFLQRVHDGRGERFGLPTEAQQEFAIRGPVVNLREVMREESVNVRDFADLVRDRYENFVERVEMGARIFTDPTDEELRRILEGDGRLFAWRVFGTSSGRAPTAEEAWFNRSGTAPADWGPENDYGLKGLVGGISEWSADWYGRDYYRKSPAKDPLGPQMGDHYVVRGGTWRSNRLASLRAACRGYNPAVRNGRGGFRVAAVPEDSNTATLKNSL